MNINEEIPILTTRVWDLDLEEIHQSLKESYAAQDMLMVLDAVDYAAAVAQTLEDSIEIFYVKHCE